METVSKNVKDRLIDQCYEFTNIIDLYNLTVNKNSEISTKLTNLKEKYNELIKINTNKVFLFCLNSLYFQYKILNMELENFNKINSLIQNRMYGDYYKLYNIIISQCKDNNILFSEEEFTNISFIKKRNNSTDTVEDEEDSIPPCTFSNSDSLQSLANISEVKLEIDKNVATDGLNESRFPVYKDVDPFFKYKLEDIIHLHDRIMYIINKLDDIYISKKENTNNHKRDICVGYSLKIFLNTLEYENEILKGQINLYLDYILFYHNSQKKYLENLLKKTEDFVNDMDLNIFVNTLFIEENSKEYITQKYATIAPLQENAECLVKLLNTSLDCSKISDNLMFSDEILQKDENHVDSIRSESLNSSIDSLNLAPLDEIIENNDLMEYSELQQNISLSFNTYDCENTEEVLLNLDIQENPCGDILIDNLSDNMMCEWNK